MKLRVSFLADISVEGAKVPKEAMVTAVASAMEYVGEQLGHDILDALADEEIEPDSLTVDVDEITVR